MGQAQRRQQREGFKSVGEVNKVVGCVQGRQAGAWQHLQNKEEQSSVGYCW